MTLAIHTVSYSPLCLLSFNEFKCPVLSVPALCAHYWWQLLERRAGFLSLFGKNYKTRDGTTIRDYVHPSDLAGTWQGRTVQQWQCADRMTALDCRWAFGSTVVPAKGTEVRHHQPRHRHRLDCVRGAPCMCGHCGMLH